MKKTNVIIAAVFLGVFVTLLRAITGVPSFRYKLYLELETPDGIKSGYNVVEVYHSAVSIPAKGTITRARGEALFIDLGPGRRPLIALVTNKLSYPNSYQGNWGDWSCFEILARLYGERFTDYGRHNENIRALVKYSGQRDIKPGKDLPTLVTFADVNDCKTVEIVDPANLEATLGPGIKWHKLSLGITNERLTSGIDEKVPCLSAQTQGRLSGTPLNEDKTVWRDHITDSDFKLR